MLPWAVSLKARGSRLQPFTRPQAARPCTSAFFLLVAGIRCCDDSMGYGEWRVVWLMADGCWLRRCRACWLPFDPGSSRKSKHTHAANPSLLLFQSPQALSSKAALHHSQIMLNLLCMAPGTASRQGESGFFV